jgi:hypothetical protein
MREHVYEVRPRKDHRGVDLISDALPLTARPASNLQFAVLGKRWSRARKTNK